MSHIENSGRELVQLVFPITRGKEALKSAHISGFGYHVEANKTTEKIKYSGLSKDVKQFCKYCKEMTMDEES